MTLWPEQEQKETQHNRETEESGLIFSVLMNDDAICYVTTQHLEEWFFFEAADRKSVV